MAALFWALLWVALLLLLIIIVVINLPVRFDARFDSRQAPKLQMDIWVLAGLVPIHIPGSTREPKVKPEKQKSKKVRSRLRLRPIMRAVPRFFSSIIKTAKVDRLRVDIDYGFDDPADTGMVFGLLKPLEFLVDQNKAAHFSIEPDFDRPRLDGNGQIAVKFTPISLIPPVLRFGWAAFISPRFSR